MRATLASAVCTVQPRSTHGRSLGYLRCSMGFRLQSPYPPAGDQPQAIAELVAGLRAGQRQQTLLGVTGSGKTFTVANVLAAWGRPADTVRGWLRRFGSRAGLVRAFFIRLLVEVGVDPVPPAQAPSRFADAVAAVAGASVAAVSRWPGIGEVPPWWLACAASGGRLLAPGWPQ